MQGIRRFARHQQHRQAGAHQVVHAHGGIGRARIHMHHDALALTGHCGIAARHVDGHVFMRAKDDLGHRLAFGLQAGHLVNQGHMIGAEIGKQVLHPCFLQTFQKIPGGGVANS